MATTLSWGSIAVTASDTDHQHGWMSFNANSNKQIEPVRSTLPEFDYDMMTTHTKQTRVFDRKK